MTNTTNQPTHKIVGNITPEADKAYWVTYGAAWPTTADPNKLAIKLHSIPTDPNVTLLLVPNEPKETQAQSQSSATPDQAVQS